MLRRYRGISFTLTPGQYPKENEYNQYLAQHSGYSNAYTASTSTNYFFEVAATSESEQSSSQVNGNTTHDEESSPLYGALDRFAQFFIAPLFLEETLDRELRAVDSENKKNLQNDTWRLVQLAKSLSNPKHPFYHFSTGNLQTLRDEPVSRGVNIRDEFMRFHDEQYSANRMKLAVLGRESLDKLQEWVESLFKDVINKNLDQNRWDGISWASPKELQKIVFAKPVMDSRQLKITFPFTDEEHLYDEQPGRYLAHLLGHEGPGSILAYTKAKGWVNSLSAGSNDVCPGSPGMFTISLSLTQDGLKNYEELTRVIFEYFSILHETPPQKWIFDEIKIMSEVDFKFKQKSAAWRTTSGLAEDMQEPIPRDRLLNGDCVRKFDAEIVKEALSWLKADNVHLTIVSRDPLPATAQRERWYGTEYVEQDISKGFLNSLRDAERLNEARRTPELHLPSKNEFIPSRLDVNKKDVAEPAKAPKLIRHEANVRLWFKKDDQFWVPKANVQINLRNPLAGSTPQTLVMLTLLEWLVDDALVEYAYDADIAGLAYSFQGGYNAMGVGVSGYNDKMTVLLEKVLTTLRDLEIKPDRFEIIKERAARGFKNVDYGPPYQQVSQYSRYLGAERAYIYDQLINEIGSITVEDVRAFHNLMLRKAHIEALVQGNVDREDALRVADMVERVLHPQPLPEAEWPIRRSLVLPPGSHYVYERQLKDEQNVNHCIEYMLQTGHVGDRDMRARLLVFAQMTEEPAFDQLRTKEQLGYVVFSGVASNICTDAYHVLIQSEKPPHYLEQRIDSFLSSYRDELVNMTDDKFESHKRSIINKRLEKLKNLNQECGRFWTHITSEFLNFEAVDDDVARIRRLRKQDVVDFYNRYIDPLSESRAKLSVHLLAKATPEDVAKDVDPSEQRSTLARLASDFFKQMQLDASVEDITQRLESVSLQGAQVANDVADALVEYLRSNAGLTDDSQVAQVKAQIQAAMEQVLPTLGIQAGAPQMDEMPNNVVKGVKAATKIENVHTWKASIPLSEGAKPMRDLSVFEDKEAKL